MRPNRLLRASVQSAAALTLIGVVGCKDTGPARTEFFSDEEAKLVTTALDCQAANGSRFDAMLRPQHFDGGQLNSLGRSKLDHLLGQPGPVVVYVAGAVGNAVCPARRDAVVAYAKQQGRTEEQLKVEEGTAPATLHAAGPGLMRLAKTERGDLSVTAADNETLSTVGLGLSGNTTARAAGSTGKQGG